MEVPSDNVIPLRQQGTQIPEQYLLMAAAQMHQEGRLLKPKDDEATPKKAHR